MQIPHGDEVNGTIIARSGPACQAAFTLPGINRRQPGTPTESHRITNIPETAPTPDFRRRCLIKAAWVPHLLGFGPSLYSETSQRSFDPGPTGESTPNRFIGSVTSAGQPRLYPPSILRCGRSDTKRRSVPLLRPGHIGLAQGGRSPSLISPLCAGSGFCSSGARDFFPSGALSAICADRLSCVDAA